MAAKAIITADRLRQLLDYDPDTGLFTWLPRDPVNQYVQTWNTRYANRVAGTFHNGKYVQINVEGKLYSCHRLAWLYVYGEFPDRSVDHINRDPSDNRLCNLRLAEPHEQMQNLPIRRHNTSGHTGVSYAKHAKKWVARISHRRRLHHLGYYCTREAAAAAYRGAKAKLHTFNPEPPSC